MVETNRLRYLCDQAALNEIVAEPKAIIVRKVELVEHPQECELRVTFRAFADERCGRRETHTLDYLFPDLQAAKDNMRDLRQRGGFRHEEKRQFLPR